VVGRTIRKKRQLLQYSVLIHQFESNANKLWAYYMQLGEYIVIEK